MKLDKHSIELLKYSNDPVLFTTDILGLECKWFHQEWIRAFENNRFSVLLAPRGHGKTSIVGSYITWRICRDRDIRILIVTINQDKANDIMTFIQNSLDRNDKLKEVFGDFKGYSIWSREKITVSGRDTTKVAIKEPTLKVSGVGGGLIGGHYNLIILDDITDEESSRLENRRRTLENWYEGPLIGTFEPDIKLINIGTRWHEDDFHSYLMAKSGFKTLRYKAILNEEELAEGKPAKVLWPERFPWESDEPDAITLKFIREHQGETYFQLQYQNNIVARGLSKFKTEWIDAAINKFKQLEGTIPINLKRYIGVDLGGEDTSSDWGVTTVVGTDDKGDVYVLESHRVHGSPNHQFEIMQSLDDKWRASRIGMESVAQQSWSISKFQKENPNLPILPIKSSWVNDKDTRTDRLSILFETNRVYLNPSLSHLIDELRLYPVSKHDDCIDSLSFAIEASQDKGIIDWSRVSDIMIARQSQRIKKV